MYSAVKGNISDKILLPRNPNEMINAHKEKNIRYSAEGSLQKFL